MSVIQLRNQLKTTDPITLTPDPDDGSATTRYKDIYLEVESPNQPLTIELFKDANTAYDPFVQVYKVPKGSRGSNLVASGTRPDAENDDSGGNNDARIAPDVPPSINGVPGTLTSQSGFDYIVRVTNYEELPDNLLPQNFGLQVTSPTGNINFRDPVTGTQLDSFGNPITSPVPPTGSPVPGGNIPVQRFWDFVTRSHFYTANQTEQFQRLSDPNRYRNEGVEFFAANTGTPAAQNVRRFLNTSSGTYFYTADPNSAQFVRERLSQFRDEGDAFLAFGAQVPGTIPVYRFANLDAEKGNPLNITHFYTADPINRQTVINTLPNFRDEGVAFYVFPR